MSTSTDGSSAARQGNARVGRRDAAVAVRLVLVKAAIFLLLPLVAAVVVVFWVGV
ncbi:MAG: hypothetical protein R3D27_14650 [Hyphomicrobiaceae bacterium]